MKFFVELLGTMLLLAIVVGSGIMGEILAQGNSAVALLANAAATGAGLYVLITVFGPLSGAHFNPAVTAVLWSKKEVRGRDAASYILAQFSGAILGVLLAHVMFDLQLIQIGTKSRTGFGQWLSETVATFGLILTIVLGARHRPSAVAALVGSYIFAAYWFTASTSFANPAVTVARALTDSFAGIRPQDVGGFLFAQLAGTLLAGVSVRTMVRR